MNKRFFILLLFAWVSGAASVYAISNSRLADSLNLHYNHFYDHKIQVHDSTLLWPRLSWVQKITVSGIRTRGNSVSVYTNGTLGGIVFTEDELKNMRKDVSYWVLGHRNGKVNIYTKNKYGEYELAELVPNRLRQQKRKEKYPEYTKPNLPLIIDGNAVSNSADTYKNGLSGKYIALWASHGIYYCQPDADWRWQRATLWTTVEDLYTTEYARLVTQMLENAGAVVLQPRARVEGANLRLNSDSTWCLIDDHAGLEIGESGMPRWAEAARYWLKEAGLPETVWGKSEKTGDYEYTEDLRARGLWVNYLTGGSKANPNQEGAGIPVDVCVALHTDAQNATDDTTTIGTLAIYYDKDDNGKKVFGNGVTRQLNRDLADYLQTQIVEDIRNTTAPNWTRRQLLNSNYGEARYPVIPTALIEILNHKTMGDMRYGLDPQFRMIVSRAIYKGLLRFLHEQDGRKVIVEPLAVRKMQIQHAPTPAKDGTVNIVLSWEETIDPLEPTAQPTHYYIYMRKDNGQWTSQRVDKKSQILSLERGKRYDFYVVAANGGGKSLDSETLSAYFSTEDNAPEVLIVNNFNQIYGPQWFADSAYAGIVPNSYAVENGYSVAYIGTQNDWTRSHNWQSDNNCGWGMCYRAHQGSITIGNTHDYPCLHGAMLQRMGYSYISANVETLTEIDSTFAIVDIIAGKQRSTDSASVLPIHLQQAVKTYLNRGGKVLLSGSYLGSGMSTPIDMLWSQDVLHYKLIATHATRSGKIHFPDGVCEIRMEPNHEGLFAEAPEGLQAVGDGATKIAQYQDMRVGAGILWSGSVLDPLTRRSLTARTLVWGFPLEAARNFDEVYQYSIKLLMSPAVQTSGNTTQKVTAQAKRKR